MKQSDKSKLRSQAARVLKSQIAFGTGRASLKRKDNTSPGIHSVRTLNEYIGSLAHAAEELGVSRLKHIHEDDAVRYLLHRVESGIGAKGIARDRAALERFLGRRLPSFHELHRLSQTSSVSSKWAKGALKQPQSSRKALSKAWAKLPRSKATTKDSSFRRSLSRPQASSSLRDISRAYSDHQVKDIAMSFNDEPTRLAILIARDAGLRTHELLTLRRTGEGKAVSNQRDWRSDRHALRNGAAEYVVTGKGGLVRTVRISGPLANRLEALRLDAPRTVIDRKVTYTQRYDLQGGNALSQAFTTASKNLLGVSYGIHGLRHSYAQSRMSHLLSAGIRERTAMHIVSQEMGHMRMAITKVYLR